MMMVHVIPEENFDCDGNCIADLDCNGVWR